MSKKYFGLEDDEFCYEIDHFINEMKERELKELTIIEAKRVTGSDYFFCKFVDDVCEKYQSCGKICDNYAPNNGKNGRCKYFGYCYEPTEKTKTLKRR